MGGFPGSAGWKSLTVPGQYAIINVAAAGISLSCWKYRGVAQLVARLVWDQDAAGSNPVTSTTYTTSANWLIMLVCGLFFAHIAG